MFKQRYLVIDNVSIILVEKRYWTFKYFFSSWMRCEVSLCITSYLCQHFIRFPQHSAGFQLFNPSWKNNTDRKVSLQEHKMKTMARLEPEHLSFSSPTHFRPLHPHIRKATFLIYTGSCKRKKIAIYPSPRLTMQEHTYRKLFFQHFFKFLHLFCAQTVVINKCILNFIR